MKFLLEIITPERLAFTEEVTLISVPTTDGRIGVLARHVPLFTSLVEGEVKIVGEKGEYFLAIGGGFMQVMKDKVIILVSRAVHAHELNEAEIQEAERQAREWIAKAEKGKERAQAQSMLRRTFLDMKVLHKRRSGSTPFVN